MITPENVTKHELTGLKAKTGKTSGTIARETKNTIIITNQKGEKKTIIKANNTFTIALPGGETVEISGKNLQGSPQERIKKKNKVKNRWLET